MNPQIMQRISITVDESLAQAFDELIAKRGYQNRSEAFRDLLKKELAQGGFGESFSRMCGRRQLHLRSSKGTSV